MLFHRPSASTREESGLCARRRARATDPSGADRRDVALPRPAQVLAKVGSSCIALLGLVVLTGWLFDIAPLKAIVPGLLPVPVSTACCLVLAGIALRISLAERGQEHVGYAHTVSLGCAAAVLAAGIVTLLLQGFGLPGLDQLFGSAAPEVAQTSRMAPTSALGFVLFGLAMLLPTSRPGGAPAWSAAAGLLISLLALVGHVYDMRFLYAVSPFRPMTVPTAIGLALLFTSFLLAHPQRGWLAAIVSEGLSGALRRHVLPTALAVPFVLGWLMMSGREAPLYDPTFGTPLLALASLVAITAIVWRTAIMLEQSEGARTRFDAALRDSETRYRAIVDTAVDAITVIDERGTILAFNRAAEQLFGYQTREVLGENVRLLMPEPYRSAHDGYLARYRETGERRIIGIGREVEGLRRDGSRFPIELAVAEWSQSGRRFFTGLIRDISARKQAAETLVRQARRQAIIAELGQRALNNSRTLALMEEAVARVAEGLEINLADVLELLPQRQVLLLRAGAGWREGVVGRAVVSCARETQAGYTLLSEAPVVIEDLRRETRFSACPLLCEHGAMSGVSVLIGRLGEPYGVLRAHSRSARSFDADDINFLQSIANVLAAAVERERAEQRLRDLALFDALTRLPNRALFRDRAEQALAGTRRSGRGLAVLLLDLDRFKDVNDTLGHPAGDLLLTETARRLRGCVRATDTVARLGGDEFALVLPDIETQEDAAVVARKIVASLRLPFMLEGNEAFVGTSVGIALAPADGCDPDDLLRHADLALYRAKAEGRGTFHFYVARLSAEVAARKALERDLRRALDQNELQVYFQPEVELTQGVITGAETLVRWFHPVRGMIPPAEFIPIAEESGLIVPLGRWVLQAACRAAKRWREAGLPPLIVAVNVSFAQIRLGQLADDVEAVLEDVGFDPLHLELEFTESVFLHPDQDSLLDGVRRLHQAGVCVTIDDFGTGYSSLARLRRLPVDKVKIDRSFVAALDCDPDAEAIVRAVIRLARSLGLSVIAEGVETEVQLRMLQAMGCYAVQGHHLGRPLPAEQFEALVRERLHRPGRQTQDDPSKLA